MTCLWADKYVNKCAVSSHFNLFNRWCNTNILLHNSLIPFPLPTHFWVHKHVCRTKYPGLHSAPLGWSLLNSQVFRDSVNAVWTGRFGNYKWFWVVLWHVINKCVFVYFGGWTYKPWAVCFLVLAFSFQSPELCYSPLLYVQHRTNSQSLLPLCTRSQSRSPGCIPWNG
jgi:hypothetical protein